MCLSMSGGSLTPVEVREFYLRDHLQDVTSYPLPSAPPVCLGDVA
jgi:hypothetical protein